MPQITTNSNDVFYITNGEGNKLGMYKPKMKNIKNAEFVMFFARNVTCLLKYKPTKKDIIVATFLDKMQKDNIIYILKNIKLPLAKKLNCTISYIEKVINELIEKNVLYRIGVGVYVVNPYIFGRGDMQYIQRLRWQFDAIFDSNDNVKLNYEIVKEYKEN